MNYGEIKSNIISLGFADEEDWNEYEELGYTYDCINRAVSFIGTDFPYIASYEFEIDDTDEGILYIDMEDVSGFLELEGSPAVFEKNGSETYKEFSDYRIEKDHTLVIDASNKGSYRVYYKSACNKIDRQTPMEFELQLPRKVHHLVPLLASYYLWLEDMPSQAQLYYNEYAQKAAEITSDSEKPKCRIATEWRGI